MKRILALVFLIIMGFVFSIWTEKKMAESPMETLPLTLETPAASGAAAAVLVDLPPVTEEGMPPLWQEPELPGRR